MLSSISAGLGFASASRWPVIVRRTHRGHHLVGRGASEVVGLAARWVTPEPLALALGGPNLDLSLAATVDDLFTGTIVGRISRICGKLSWWG